MSQVANFILPADELDTPQNILLAETGGRKVAVPLLNLSRFYHVGIYLQLD